MRMAYLVLWCGVLAVAAGGCATNPVSQRREFVLMSQSRELDVGRRMAPEITSSYGAYANAGLQAYVAQVGRQLATVSDRADIAFHFTVLDSPEVNAFALPGGYVFIKTKVQISLSADFPPSV